MSCKRQRLAELEQRLNELKRLRWDVAITRKRRETAFAEGRIDDVNRLDKYMDALALEYQALIREEGTVH